MVTPDEIVAIPLFSAVPEAERERLSRVSADIQLRAGEYAVNEGDERALFAMLEGHIEVVKNLDGVERVLGHRVQGDIFGEVPLTLGMPFPAGYRAAEPSRIMRIEAHDYHAVAATVPDVAVKVGEIARGRIGGLQHIVAEPPPPRAFVVGARYDSVCSGLRQFLDRNEITFVWTEQAGLEPTEIRFADGRTIAAPTLRQVAERLGLHTQPRDVEYDTVIIGGGPAGLAAAVYGASEGLRTLVIEREAPGGQAGTSSRIENYLGFPNGSLRRRARPAARSARPSGSAPRSWSRADRPASTPRRAPIHLDGGDEILRRGRSSSPPA